jgi:replicative DNA helicase
VAWLPFEDGLDRTYARLSSIDGEFSSFQLDVGNATPEELETAQYHLDRVLALPIFMEERHMYADQIFSWTMRQVAVNGIGVLFLDAWKDILRKKHDLGEDEAMSRTMCELARRAGIPVVINHHVRKGIAGEDRSDLSEADIRGTGQIANDARQIIILQNRLAADGQEEFEFDLAKNSYGPTGRYPMVRVSKFNKWVEPGDYKIG